MDHITPRAAQRPFRERTLERNLERNLGRNLERNLGRNLERNLGRNLERNLGCPWTLNVPEPWMSLNLEWIIHNTIYMFMKTIYPIYPLIPRYGQYN